MLLVFELRGECFECAFFVHTWEMASYATGRSLC
jgi:hypothetical protein